MTTLRKVLPLLLLLSFVLFPQGKQNNVQTGLVDAGASAWKFPTRTFTNLPAAASSTGLRFTVTDCVTSACTAGSGTLRQDMVSTGSAWVPAVSNGAVTDANGNVGIGTTGPGQLLDVEASGSSYIQVGDTLHAANIKIGVNDAGPWPGIWLNQTTPSSLNYTFLSDGNTLFNTPVASNMQFRVGNATKMVIDTNGNVGIGTTSPAYSLDVSKGVGLTGTARFFDQTATTGTTLVTITPGAAQTANSTVLSVGGSAMFTSIATIPVATSALPACVATTGTPWRASVNNALAPALGVVLASGGAAFANVHCSLTTGTYIVDGI